MPLILQRCPPTARLHDLVTLSLARVQVLGCFATSWVLGCLIAPAGFLCSGLHRRGLYQKHGIRAPSCVGEPARLAGPPTGLYYQSQGLKWGKNVPKGMGL